MRIIKIRTEEYLFSYAKDLSWRMRGSISTTKEVSFAVDFPYKFFSLEQAKEISKKYGGDGHLAFADDFCRATVTIPVGDPEAIPKPDKKN